MGTFEWFWGLICVVGFRVQFWEFWGFGDLGFLVFLGGFWVFGCVTVAFGVWGLGFAVWVAFGGCFPWGFGFSIVLVGLACAIIASFILGGLPWDFACFGLI